MSALRFTKMHGAGNDYVYVDCFDQHVADPASLARRVSPRRTGVGADGLILIGPSRVADCRMEIYNADGSRAEMCGNGIRCVAKYVYEHGRARRNPLRVETDAGIKELVLQVRGGRVEQVCVDMGVPVLEADQIPVAARGQVIDAPLEVAGEEYRITCVSMGNPHGVVFVESVASLDLARLGPAFENHVFFPRRVNAEFAEVIGRREVAARVWERGSGETSACGTGACAVAVAGVLTGRTDRRVRVRLPGGDLEVEWRAADGHVLLTGGAEEVFRGEIDWDEP